MISLILPYWQRPEATDKSLLRLAELYPTLDMEVVIVDDGSRDVYYAPRAMPWPIQIVRLPSKMEPKNACLPINVGVYRSGGEHIALSCPEILHRTPVLSAMRDAIQNNNDYVVAACWAPESHKWHAHSSIAGGVKDGVKMPGNSCFNFLSMMKRDLWLAAGGMDPHYREGHCYEDTDFIKRLEEAGAKFIMRDDLVVDHPREGAKVQWSPELVARNRALFQSKWRLH